jgi:hypothetical protein
MFEAYASGMGNQAITLSLEERGVLTRRGKELWDVKRVKCLLQNHVYTGIRHYNRMTLTGERPKGRKHGRLVVRDRSVWVGVPVPAIISL